MANWEMERQLSAVCQCSPNGTSQPWGRAGTTRWRWTGMDMCGVGDETPMASWGMDWCLKIRHRNPYKCAGRSDDFALEERNIHADPHESHHRAPARAPPGVHAQVWPDRE
jgi:hypothetical protein